MTRPMILPGATLGLLGGGQLGRLFVLAARAMGYRVTVLDPAVDSPAAQVADRHLAADYDDEQALEQLARGGIYTGVTLMPVLPFLEDSEENIITIVRRAAEAGAAYRVDGLGMLVYQAVEAFEEVARVGHVAAHCGVGPCGLAVAVETQV